MKDVSTLKNTLSRMDSVLEGKPTLVVMDKGFYSTRNINSMLDDPSNIRFIIAVPFTAGFAIKQVESERKDIDCQQNTIVNGGASIWSVTVLRSWSTDHKLYTHVYFNAMKAMNLRKELYAHVTVLKEQACRHTKRGIQQLPADTQLGEITFRIYISIKKYVIAKELDTAGWMVIIRNDMSNAKEAISIYREKDFVEKGFLRLKNSLDLGRLRVHRADSMQNKVFIGFIALILLSYIHTVMSEKDLYRQMTMKKLIMTLAKLRVQEINGHTILFPLTKQQKEIFKASFPHIIPDVDMVFVDNVD